MFEVLVQQVAFDRALNETQGNAKDARFLAIFDAQLAKVKADPTLNKAEIKQRVRRIDAAREAFATARAAAHAFVINNSDDRSVLSEKDIQSILQNPMSRELKLEGFKDAIFEGIRLLPVAAKEYVKTFTMKQLADAAAGRYTAADKLQARETLARAEASLDKLANLDLQNEIGANPAKLEAHVNNILNLAKNIEKIASVLGRQEATRAANKAIDVLQDALAHLNRNMQALISTSAGVQKTGNSLKMAVDALVSLSRVLGADNAKVIETARFVSETARYFFNSVNLKFDSLVRDPNGAINNDKLAQVVDGIQGSVEALVKASQFLKGADRDVAKEAANAAFDLIDGKVAPAIKEAVSDLVSKLQAGMDIKDLQRDLGNLVSTIEKSLMAFNDLKGSNLTDGKDIKGLGEKLVKNLVSLLEGANGNVIGFTGHNDPSGLTQALEFFIVSGKMQGLDIDI
jgi:hypothetical protein